MKTAIILLAAVAASMLGQVMPGTAAGCRDDMLTADQNVRRTRTGLDNAAGDTDAAQCTAYRRHIDALSDYRSVIARCDRGPNQSQNVQAVDTEIVTLAPRMRAVCKP
ncbi:hypothetical protein [Bradyrhizobium sp. 2TAF24]|uniref:hypothetical protein n=1 Tax=Bradyrhizobium sp. 2TAF24 TaxID=3233011 RepID=UPI003F9056BF